MPINLDFSSSNDALKRVAQFMQYDLLNKRAAERQQKTSMLEDALMRGRQEQKYGMDVSLEEQKTGNEMAKAKHTAMLAIAQDPQFDAMLSILNLGKMGKLGPEDQPIYEQAQQMFPVMLNGLSQAAYKLAIGEAKPEDFGNVVVAMGSKAAEWASKELGMNLRAKEQILVDQEANRISRIRAEQEKKTYEDPATKRLLENQIKDIDRAIGHVQANGLYVKQGTLAQLRQQYEGITGKAFDTYPPNVASQIKTELQKMSTQVGKGTPLTQFQEEFLAQSYNAFEMRNAEGMNVEGAATPGQTVGRATPGAPATGGARSVLPSPATGMSPTDSTVAQERARENDVRYYINKYLNLMYPERNLATEPWTDQEIAEARPFAEKWVKMLEEQNKVR